MKTEQNRQRSLHVLYGGAHLFKSDARAKLTGIVRRTWEDLVPDHTALARVFDVDRALLARVHEGVTRSLDAAVHDVRIDFEDGFGPRPDDEEDNCAAAAARAIVEGVRAGSLPARVGIRPKAFAGDTEPRARRTLARFFSTLFEQKGPLPTSLVVTLPKVERASEVRTLVGILEEASRALGVSRAMFEIELMVETPRALVDESGRLSVRALVDAGDGLVESVHLGAYDLLASLDVPARTSSLLHPTLDVARGLLQFALAGTGVAVVDGATTLLPVGPHKLAPGTPSSTKEAGENRQAIVHALRLHAAHVARALDHGISRGWDLHPAQTLARQVALVVHAVREVDGALARLNAFLDAQAHAMRSGSVFDDAASARGLVNTVLFALRVGVLDDAALATHGLNERSLRAASFAELVAARAQRAPQ